MAIPTDLASCVCWHEAFNQPEADGVRAPQIVGVGGMPHAGIQATEDQRFELETLGSGRRAFLFDHPIRNMDTAANLVAPCTVIYAAVQRSAAAGDRRALAGAGHNIYFGTRSSGVFNVENGSGSINDGAIDTNLHIHTVIKRNSGTRCEYRIDGVSVGGNANTTEIGAMRFAGFFSEYGDCHIIGMSAFDEELVGTDLTDQEDYWLTGEGGSISIFPPYLTQLSGEAVSSMLGQPQLTGLHGEAVLGASADVIMSQFGIEVVRSVSESTPPDSPFTDVDFESPDFSDCESLTYKPW